MRLTAEIFMQLSRNALLGMTVPRQPALAERY